MGTAIARLVMTQDITEYKKAELVFYKNEATIAVSSKVRCIRAFYDDSYGHLAGDEYLRQVAAAIRKALKRPEDLGARYGGEEFAVILPNTDEEDAVCLAETIRHEVKNLQSPHLGFPGLKWRHPEFEDCPLAYGQRLT